MCTTVDLVPSSMRTGGSRSRRPNRTKPLRRGHPSKQSTGPQVPPKHGSMETNHSHHAPQAGPGAGGASPKATAHAAEASFQPPGRSRQDGPAPGIYWVSKHKALIAKESLCFLLAPPQVPVARAVVIDNAPNTPQRPNEAVPAPVVGQGHLPPLPSAPQPRTERNRASLSDK